MSKLRSTTSTFLTSVEGQQAKSVENSRTSLRPQERTVRLQMVWDNLSCLGTEALARLGLRLGGFQLMFQSSLSDGVAFDPFSFQKDGSASAEVDVGRCQVL